MYITRTHNLTFLLISDFYYIGLYQIAHYVPLAPLVCLVLSALLLSNYYRIIIEPHFSMLVIFFLYLFCLVLLI